MNQKSPYEVEEYLCQSEISALGARCLVDIGVDRVTSGKSDRGVFGVSVSISAVPLSTIFGSRQFRRRPDICHLFYINILLGSIFLHMKARKLWQKLHKFCIYGNFFYITHILYVENFRFLHICHVETSGISPHVEKFSISPQLSYMES